MVPGPYGDDVLLKNGVELQWYTTKAPSEDIDQLNIKTPKGEIIIIDGNQAILHKEGKWGAYLGSTGRTVDILHGTQAYRFVVSYTDGDEARGSAIFDKIISTIKYPFRRDTHCLQSQTSYHVKSQTGKQVWQRHLYELTA